VAALALLDIRVLDHIIIGRGSAFSFAEHGLAPVG
jgi:DNA repair protein RadC